MKRFLYAVVLLAFSAAAAGAAPKTHYTVAPPGQVIQDTVAYLTGEAMHSAWHIVASRKLAGKNMGQTPVYQWYLSFYTPEGKLAYQLPGSDEALLARIIKADGAQMYFPTQNVKIIGSAEFERFDVQDVVVEIHQAGADCGGAAVAVFGANANEQVVQRVRVRNPCALTGKIVKHGALSAVRLSGPYYAPKAAMCCPTKPTASALLSYANGTWSIAPKYYVVSVSPADHR